MMLSKSDAVTAAVSYAGSVIVLISVSVLYDRAEGLSVISYSHITTEINFEKEQNTRMTLS